jgi:hypothetical protein
MTGTDGGSMMAPGLTLRQEFAELAKGGLDLPNSAQAVLQEPHNGNV